MDIVEILLPSPTRLSYSGRFYLFHELTMNPHTPNAAYNNEPDAFDQILRAAIHAGDAQDEFAVLSLEIV